MVYAKKDLSGCLRHVRKKLPATMNCFSLTCSDGRVLNVQTENAQIFKDDLTGQLLDPTLVAAARKKDLEYFDGKNVWELTPISECRRHTGKHL